MTLYTKEYIQNLILCDEVFMKKSLLKIYRRQTQSEKNQGKCFSKNKKGFSSYDSVELNRISKRILNGIPLNSQDKYICQYKLQKYWKQIQEIILNETKWKV